MLMAQELPSRCITNAHRAGRTLSVASASAGDVLQGPQQFVELLSVIQRAETVRAIASLVQHMPGVKKLTWPIYARCKAGSLQTRSSTASGDFVVLTSAFETCVGFPKHPCSASGGSK